MKWLLRQIKLVWVFVDKNIAAWSHKERFDIWYWKHLTCCQSIVFQILVFSFFIELDRISDDSFIWISGHLRCNKRRIRFVFFAWAVNGNGKFVYTCVLFERCCIDFSQTDDLFPVWDKRFLDECAMDNFVQSWFAKGKCLDSFKCFVGVSRQESLLFYRESLWNVWCIQV